MEIQQVHNIKRIGSWLAASLLILSVGLMLLGWTVSRKVAFDAGVFGFQLFPVAILAVLIRIMLPIVLITGHKHIHPEQARLRNLGLGTIDTWLFSQQASPHHAGEATTTPCRSKWAPNLSAMGGDPFAVKDPMGSPLRKGYTNTSPAHESFISNPDGYLPNYDAMFDGDD